MRLGPHPKSKPPSHLGGGKSCRARNRQQAFGSGSKRRWMKVQWQVKGKANPVGGAGVVVTRCIQICLNNTRSDWNKRVASRAGHRRCGTISILILILFVLPRAREYYAATVWKLDAFVRSRPWLMRGSHRPAAHLWANGHSEMGQKNSPSSGASRAPLPLVVHAHIKESTSSG